VVTVIALSWVLPVLLEAWKWNIQGGVWQGRYILPTVCLIPILAAARSAESDFVDQSTKALNWSRLGALAVLALMHFWAFTVLLRRNVHGLTGPGLPPNDDPPWHPPGLGPTELLACLATVMVISLVLVGKTLLTSPRMPAE